MRREIRRQLSGGLAALSFNTATFIILLLTFIYVGWRSHAPIPVSERLNQAWFMLFYTPPTWRLEWGDAERIRPLNLSGPGRVAFGGPDDWLIWVPREKPWWEPDEPL